MQPWETVTHAAWTSHHSGEKSGGGCGSQAVWVQILAQWQKPLSVSVSQNCKAKVILPTL